MKLPVQVVKKQMKTSPYLDLFVWMLCRIDEKVGKFLSFQDISWSVKNTKGQTYSEPDVGMRFTANISNVWAQTSLCLTRSQTLKTGFLLTGLKCDWQVQNAAQTDSIVQFSSL